MANKFIENLIIGKSNCDLPKTRKQQFKILTKDNFFKLLKYSLFIGLFIIPIIVIKIIFSYSIADMADSNKIFVYLYRESFINVFLITLVSIPVSGVSYIIRKKVWNDSILSESIFTGIKKEIKRFVFIFFIIGLSNFIFQTGSYYYGNIFIGQSIIKNVLTFINVIQFIFILILSMYMITMTTRYNLSFKDLILNSFKLSIKFLFKNLLAIFIILLPWIILQILPPAYQVVVVIVISPLYYSLSILLIYEYTAYIYDEHINKEKFTDIYKKGLKID